MTNDGASPVRLEPLTESHVSDAYVGWLNDPRVNRFMEWRFTPQTTETVTEWVRSIQGDASNRAYAIIEEATGRHVGNIKLGFIDMHHRIGEIGILVGDPSTWGKGYGSWAIHHLSRIGFDDVGLRRIYAGCYGSNIGSRRAFEKAGFKVEATLRDHFMTDDGLEDRIIMSCGPEDLSPPDNST